MSKYLVGNHFSSIFALTKQQQRLPMFESTALSDGKKEGSEGDPIRKPKLKVLNRNAEIAQLVEHNLAKVGVASSSLVFCSQG